MVNRTKVEKKPKVPTTMAIFKSLPNAINEWHYMKPLDKHLYFYGIGRLSMKMIGFSIFQETQSIPWYGYFAAIKLAVNFSLMFYTAYYWTIHGEFAKFLPCTCMQIGPLVGVRCFDSFVESRLLYRCYILGIETLSHNHIFSISFLRLFL